MVIDEVRYRRWKKTREKYLWQMLFYTKRYERCVRMGKLAAAVENERRIVIQQIKLMGVFKASDGRSLSELTLTELQQEHKHAKKLKAKGLIGNAG